MKRHRSNADLRTFLPCRWAWWWRRRRPAHNGLLFLLFLLAFLYLLFLSLKLPRFLQISSSSSSMAPPSLLLHRRLEDSHRLLDPPSLRPLQSRYGRLTSSALLRLTSNSSSFSDLERMAAEAWSLGSKAWNDLDIDGNSSSGSSSGASDRKVGPCPLFVSMNAEELGDTAGGERLMFLPCGLAAGSSITVVGKPHGPHVEYVPQIARTAGGDGRVMVSQFMVELQGLKAVDGEDPPRILHLNPRLKGDWSKVPVIEHNTCYRMQWGVAQRCDGVPSKDSEDAVDGFAKCEKWIRDDVTEDSKESKTTSWLRRFIGRAKKPAMTWPFPFVEDKLFVLTIRAGVEGYHINVGGRHITSFPYRTGFTLEDATGFSVKGNVDLHSVYATSLPSSHPSFSVERVLEMSEKWKTRPLPGGRIDLFIGILSATNHFAERMAIRKTWMQSEAIKSSRAVARFFVALNTRREVNAMLKKEADYFGDMVILPFMDRYELVVLKTIAICEYGVQNLTAAFIMKCDDDTFVRIDTILKEIYSFSGKKSLYMGNLNLLHRPLRNGKWAVTYEEWPEEIYPPYANGPGYIISIDVAQFVVSQHTNHSLRLFKMEDVSMGMWVEEFNGTNPVQYSHNRKFCQHGCMENYFTSHYQSPRQMICLWDKLARGRAQCCNFR